MCGIAGFIGPDLAPERFVDLLTGMLRRIGHRGPDGLGYMVTDSLALGATRLAIIDIAQGDQPLGHRSGDDWLVYNGEVYNYLELRQELEAEGVVFETQSDTEVVLEALRAWGIDALARFNGSFALAFHDRRTERTILARDRYGKRPLFITRHLGGLFFASEMKAFLDVPGFRFEQDPDQLRSIVAQWTPLPQQTGFVGIENLPMGSAMVVENGETRITRYDRMSFTALDAPEDEGAARERIRAALTDSVNLRLRSDVEVGVYLSGGIDSAIVAQLGGALSAHQLSTFSVAFDDKTFDESPEQLDVANLLGTRHEIVQISDRDIVDNLPDAVFHAEIPAFRSAFVPMYLLARRTREAGIKVILSGEGADEAFLGYDLFKEVLLRGAWNDLDETQIKARLAGLYPHLPHYGESAMAPMLGLYAQFAEEKMPGLFSHELRFQNGRFATRLVPGEGDPFKALYALTADEPGYANMSPMAKAQWLEYQTLLHGYLLSTQGERMSMAHGVENRCPFLDQGVIDIARAVNLKFDDGFTEKRLLRETFREVLPASVVNKRKFPYRAPDSAAFAACKPDYLDMLLSETELRKMPFLDGRFARRLADKLMRQTTRETSPKEDQAFIFLLSIALIDRLFVRREGVEAAPRTPITPPLMAAVDLRTAA